MNVKLNRRESVLGYQVWSGSLDECADEIVGRIEGRGDACWLACINPHSYAVSVRRSLFASALHSADWLIPDGVGVVFASIVFRGLIRRRITGSDIFVAIHDRLQARGGGTVFFLGSTEEALREIRQRMALDWPALKVAGTYSPPFRDEFSEAEVEEMVLAINSVRPEVLWVGMTAPKQEEWIQRVHGRLDVRFVGAIGAVFDFYIGRIKRPHPVFQRLGLEWLPRLIQEPRRLWRRTFVSGPVFLLHALLQRFGKEH